MINNPDGNSEIPEEEQITLEVSTESDLDLLTNQTSAIARDLLAGEIAAAEGDNQQLGFVKFLRLFKTEEQLIALAELFTDFELILILHHNIDSFDESDPLGRQSLENSAKKTLLLLDCVTRVLNNILRIKPEVHYIKETHRLRKNTPLPVDQYYRMKSPELDLIKSYTNFDQLKTLLTNSVSNRQIFDLLDNLQDRVVPQFKEYIKGLRRRDLTSPVIAPDDDLNIGVSTNRQRVLPAEAEEHLKQAVMSLTSTFLSAQTAQTSAQSLNPELIANLKEIYRALTEFQKTPAGHIVEGKARPLQKQIEQFLLNLNRTGVKSLSTNTSANAFLPDFLEYLAQVSGSLDTFFEHQSAARFDESYFKRLEMMRNLLRHLRVVMKEEHYHEKAQLPFLNLKSFIYFAVKVIKDLNYFNPLLHRKFRYYIERNIIDSRLQEAFRNISKDNRRERRYVIPVLLELNRLLRIVARISPNKDDLTDYQLTFYWFKLLEQNLRILITFLKSYPEDEPLANRFDTISFTLEMEAERVFGKRGHLMHLNEHSPLEEYIKRVEDSLGILGRALQENYLFIAQIYLPNLKREDLDKNYKERVVATIQLRDHTWCIWQACSIAEQQLKEHMDNEDGLELNLFLNGLLKRVQMYLIKFLPKVFYSDRVELKRTFNDLYNCAAMLANRKSAVQTQHLQQLTERVHVLTTLFASLSENIKNRSILEGKPLEEESARKILQKYLQAGERI